VGARESNRAQPRFAPKSGWTLGRITSLTFPQSATTPKQSGIQKKWAGTIPIRMHPPYGANTPAGRGFWKHSFCAGNRSGIAWELRCEVWPRVNSSAKGKLCSPLELHLLATVRARNRPCAQAELSPARFSNESRVHRRSRAIIWADRRKSRVLERLVLRNRTGVKSSM
jgi:hypothetical protein